MNLTDAVVGQEYIIRGEYWNATEKINSDTDEGSNDDEQ